MKPIVDRLEKEFKEQVAFLRLDAEHEGKAAFDSFGLRGHPSFVIIDTVGETLWQAVGEQPQDRLETAIGQALGEE